MKTILLLTSAFDDGEEYAARNLGDALKRLASSDVRAEITDLVDASQGRFDALFEYAFSSGAARGRKDLARLRDSLWDLLRDQEPDVLVFTSPLYGRLLEEIYRGGRARDFTSIALATDLVFDPTVWADVPADYFVVAGCGAARELDGAGVPESKIKIFGYSLPMLPPGAAEITTEPRFRAEAPRILYLVNNARKKAAKLLGRLLEEPAWKITACIDNDTGLEKTARALATSAPGQLEVIGHGQNLEGLLRRHQVVISRASTPVVQAAISARCPLIVPKIGSDGEEANVALLQRANAGAAAEKPREVVDWLKRAFRDEGRLVGLWRKNLEPLGHGDKAQNLARFVLHEASRFAGASALELRALPPPFANGKSAATEKSLHAVIRPAALQVAKSLLLCDFHTHTTWSDGKLTVREIVDFYGQRGFDCLCITDHLCDPKRLLGKLVNLTGLVIPPGEVGNYFEAIEREKKRAWAKYELLLMTGVEFNKDGYTAKTSAHLLGVDLKQPIDPSLELEELVREIHDQDALAIASHPHEIKSEWGKNTLYLWEHLDEYAPLLDAWEVANRDDIFNPVGLKKLPFIASSDFHKPKHIHSWKTLLYCEKEAEAIKQCIRMNRDVSLTLYRDRRFAREENGVPLPTLEDADSVGRAERRG